MFIFKLINENGKIFEVTKNLPKIEKQPLGTCFCSLINSTTDFKKFITENKFVNNYELDKRTYSEFIKKLLKINPYFRIFSLELCNNTFKINRILSKRVFSVKWFIFLLQ